MTQAFIATITHDGHVLARDPVTGVVVSGRTLDEAFAELRRLTASHTHACETDKVVNFSSLSRTARHPRGGVAAWAR